MAADRAKLAFGLWVLLIVTLAVGGCSTSIAEMTGTPAADAAAPPKEPDGYLPVHDLPPDRDEAVMTLEERAKVQAELIKARDHQAVVTATAAKDTGGNSSNGLNSNGK